MKKKLLAMLLIVMLLFNFILCNCAYADDAKSTTSQYGGNSTLSGSSAQTVAETGQDSQGNEFKQENFGSAIMGVIMQYLAIIINTLPMAIHGGMSLITYNGTTLLDIMEAMIFPDAQFTVERTVFNEIALFNINIFNDKDTYTIGLGGNSKTIEQKEPSKSLKVTTATWFYTCRLMAMMINLCVLIYVGIRMALSTVASEEAKYKKMLIGWLESMLVLFLLHYIMSFLIQMGELISNIFNSIRISMQAAGQKSFETTILNNIYFQIKECSGLKVFMYSLFYWFLTYLMIKFFITYMKRILTVMFLTIIAPFITVTYPIDKLGDGKAQAFEQWLKEYIINVLIQPIHAGIYIVFVFTAGTIAEKAPYVAMIFLLTLGKTEKILRTLFGMDKTVSSGNVDEQIKKGKKG